HRRVGRPRPRAQRRAVRTPDARRGGGTGGRPRGIGTAAGAQPHSRRDGTERDPRRDRADSAGQGGTGQPPDDRRARRWDESRFRGDTQMPVPGPADARASAGRAVALVLAGRRRARVARSDRTPWSVAAHPAWARPSVGPAVVVSRAEAPDAPRPDAGLRRDLGAGRSLAVLVR